MMMGLSADRLHELPQWAVTVNNQTELEAKGVTVRNGSKVSQNIAKSANSV